MEYQIEYLNYKIDILISMGYFGHLHEEFEEKDRKGFIVRLEVINGSVSGVYRIFFPASRFALSDLARIKASPCIDGRLGYDFMLRAKKTLIFVKLDKDGFRFKTAGLRSVIRDVSLPN